MKIIGILLLLGMAVEGVAQLAPPTVPGTVHRFQPLAVNNQKRPVEIPPPPSVKPRTQVAIMWAILLLGMLVVTIIIVRIVPMLWLKILISVGMLLIALVVSYLMLMLYAYSFDPPEYTKRDIAERAVFDMTEVMGINTPYFRILEDEEYRLAIALGEDRMIFADYSRNEGIMVPLVHLDTFLHFKGPASTLPVLPEDHWTIVTKDAQAAAADAELQQVEYHFKDIQPAKVVFRYLQVVKEIDAAEMLQTDLQRMILFYREQETTE